MRERNTSCREKSKCKGPVAENSGVLFLGLAYFWTASRPLMMEESHLTEL